MLDTDHEVDELIATNTQVEVPDYVQDRLQARLAAFQQKVETQPPSWLRMQAYSLTHPLSFRIPAMTAAVLTLLVAALMLIPVGSNASRVYAAAASQLRTAQTLEYTVVLAPHVEVAFTYLAPGYSRVNCSWGIEARSDGSGKQLVLLHGTRNYVTEEGKSADSLVNSMNLVKELKSLPNKAEQSLGEQRVDGKRLIGYRVHQAPSSTAIAGPSSFDLWVNAGTGNPDHVDITIQEQGKPSYQMHIKDIRVDAEIARSQFDMTPPAGYTALATPPAASHTNQRNTQPGILQPEIKQAGALSTVVVPVSEPTQTWAAMQSVRSHLRELGVTPLGPPLLRYDTQNRRMVGYPVPSGTRVEAPFEVISSPAATVASVVVKGPWGQDFASPLGQDPGSRWGTFLRRISEQGYRVSGPPTEIWLGDQANQTTQSTEMRIVVSKPR